MMERQELPVESRESYVYILAERDDKVVKTGRAKYLPIDTCKSHGVGCDSKTNYKSVNRREAVSPMDSSRLVKSSLMGHQEGS